MSGTDKTQRVLDIYTRLCEGKVINKQEEERRFEVSGRSIQRDIEGINFFLAERKVSDTADMREVECDPDKKGYVMTGLEDTIMSNSEILAVSKILLESRAFTEKEIDKILNNLISGCAPRESMKLVSDLIANERFYYKETHEESYIQDKLWAIGTEIKEQNLLEIDYQKQLTTEDTVKRMVQPRAILFSEYYFYLLADIVEKDEKGKYELKYKERGKEYHPAVFRIDRITKYRKTDIKFKIVYKDRFEEGEFRRKTQFMYMGSLLENLKFKYTGKSIEAVKDRFPTADVKLSHTEESSWIVTVPKVYEKGGLMWLLTQGTMVEVLGPEEARRNMKKMLQEMLAKYEEE